MRAAPPVWLAGPLREVVHDVLADKRVREAGFFDAAAVRRLLSDHEARRADRSRSLWALLMFTLWCEEYGRPPTAAVTPGVEAAR